MSSGIITMNEVLKAMESGKTFSVSFVTFDEKRRRGGQIRHYDSCVVPKRETTATKPAGEMLRARALKSDPDHYKHSIRSFRIVINGVETNTTKKLHIFLILEFNGRKLIL